MNARLPNHPHKEKADQPVQDATVEVFRETPRRLSGTDWRRKVILQ
jgi:hypothetical protein